VKSPVRIAGAALALAAVVAMQLAQPAQPIEAANKPDLRVAFGNFTHDPAHPIGIPHANFGYRNIGTATSGPIVAVRMCEYLDVRNAKTAYVAPRPAEMLPPLEPGPAKLITVDCPYSEQYGPPISVSLSFAAQDELRTDNNEDRAMYPH
jgi:hypothetical protein